MSIKPVHLALIVGLLCSPFSATCAIYYVNASNAAPASPFATWVTAATNIQDAVNLTVPGDTVLVTNGSYAYSGLAVAGTLLNRVALTNPITVQSVNGPWVTTILGAGAVNGASAVRCAWLTNGASLIGFTLTAGATLTSGDQFATESGGGVWCASSNVLVANCVVVSNTAFQYGDGIYQGTIVNTLVNSNAAFSAGSGAAYKTVLNNCTLVGNTAYGAVFPIAMTNTIIYYNLSPNVSAAGVSSHCCTIPALTGTGNFTNAPQLFADGVHLTTNSPCIGAGVATATRTDIFGLMWSNPPSVGCAEWTPAPVIFPQPAAQFPTTGGATIGVNVDGQPPFGYWWTVNGTPIQNNGHYSSANSAAIFLNNVSLSDAGAYQIVVSNSFGMITSAVSQISAHLVSPGGTEQPPYSSWATAATNIQDAINVAQNGDFIFVTNGTYASGGLAMAGNSTNRVVLNKPVLVQSINGPWVTAILGAGATNASSAIRCVWLTNGAALIGFTVQAGATLTGGNLPPTEGGGVWCASSNVYVGNCVLISNTAYSNGGGVYGGTINNCYIAGNKGSIASSGAAYSSVLNNCTIVNNQDGGAGSPLAMTNCIIYNNTVNNCFSVSGTAYSHCCTTPALAGTGNFTNAPQFFVDGVHLTQASPCIGAGVNIGDGYDIFGMAWSNPPSVGCAEWQPSPVLGVPLVNIFRQSAGFSIGNLAINGSLPMNFQWLENGLPLQNDGHFSLTQNSNLIANGILLSDAGYYQLVASNAFGMSTSQVAQVVIHSVNAAGVNPTPPYSTWATAATNIQDAVNIASAGDIVLVTNGVYMYGGMVMSSNLTNRVAINLPITVASVNGCFTTAIQGAWDPVSTNGPDAVRCAWLTNGATLIGFTLQRGATMADDGYIDASDSGGGIYCLTTNGMAVNCVLSNNSAFLGGGMANGTLNNSLVINNQAVNGGGTYMGSINNCTVVNNVVVVTGGGTYESYVQNSIVVGNYYGPFGIYGNNYDSGLRYYYSCTSPTLSGNGNINASPQFLDLYHISTSSPCRGAGSAAYATGTDMDGEPWLNPPSMGCDEVVVSNLVGPLSVNIFSTYTNVLVNRIGVYAGFYTGRAASVIWGFGDGSFATNANPTGHEWTNSGIYPVSYTVYNNDNPAGVSTNLLVQVQPLLAPQIVSPGIVSGAFQFQFAAQTNANYTIQYTTNLVPPVTWQTYQTIFFNQNSVIQITDLSWTNGTRFYQVLAQ